MNVLVEQFDEIEDPYLRERKADVVPGGRAGAEAPAGQARARCGAPGAEHQTILVAHDLSPADVIQFKQHRFGAFITDLGGVDVAHGDRRAQPQHARGRRHAQRARS